MSIKIEKKTVYTAELSCEQVGVIAYALGKSCSADFVKTAHEEYAAKELSALYAMFNGAWCNGT